MRKAKVAAIVCGLIASCLFGGFAVVEAATITLDDSSAAEAVYSSDVVVEVVYYPGQTAEEYAEAAATVTSIETTAATTTSTLAITEPVMTVITDTADEQETSVLKAIPVVKPDSYALPPVKETTAPATEAPAAQTTVQTTAATKAATQVTTTKSAAQEAPSTKTTTKAAQTEEVITNPPMPEQAAQPEAPQTQVETAAPAPETEPATEAATEAPVVVEVPSDVEISESDYILLCNAVAHEAGANSISEYEKAKVVEVIMNRVYSPNYPNTIYGVLTQKRQFSGSSTYVDLDTYSSKVTDKVKAAVDLYFEDPSAFNHGYLSFTGDGRQNYFR